MSDEVDEDRRPSDNVILGGRPWTLHRANLPKSEYGRAHIDDRLIEVDHRIRGRLELDTLIHEMLHAVYPFLAEDPVNDSASEIASILWKLGYRKVK